MTSSIPNDSLQALLENSNQAIIAQSDSLKVNLERIYETGEGSFSQEEISKDCQKIAIIVESILNTNDLQKQGRIVLSEYQPLMENLIEKYRDFLSNETIKKIEYLKNKRISNAWIISILFELKSACDESNRQKIIFNMDKVSEILETRIKYIDNNILNLIQKTALDLLFYVDSLENIESFSNEEIQILKVLKQITRSVLWQIEHPQKEEKLSDAEFDDLLNETQGIWTKGNGLAYQEQIRKGKNPDNIKQEMTSQEAAQFLKIPYVSLVKRLEQGEIPYHEVNSCKRIRLEDLIVYKQKRDEQRRQAKRELTAFLEDEGFYDDDYSMS